VQRGEKDFGLFAYDVRRTVRVHLRYTYGERVRFMGYGTRTRHELLLRTQDPLSPSGLSVLLAYFRSPGV